jgi:hypothetical protein
VERLRTTDGFFETLSVTAARGRVFTAPDVAADRVVVFSDRLWRTLFAGDPDIVGQPVVFDGTLHTIVGVLPPNFPRCGHEDPYAPLPATSRFAADHHGRPSPFL